ncbi:MAG TPA: trypsin-like peptidase domain-containing protein [Methylomirabilota bacterium]|nr:trypsin-like peptidase domain-containing protein [Methylomirabilota bacterium]
MKRLLAGILAAALLATSWSVADAQTVGQVFQRVNSSVVVIRTRERSVTAQGQVATESGVGSGVLISPDGRVITSAHVVQTADEITVEFLSGDTIPARVVASEPEADVSLLQLDRPPARPVVARLGDSDRVAVGDQIFIVGAPYGIGHTLTVGHISARHKPNTVYSAMSRAEFLQTDAAINQGNSGGPMFSMQGDVIGIVSHIISKSGGFEGLGFVVTSNMARRLLLEQRSFWSGLNGYVLTGDLARVFNLPQPIGLLVQRVAKNSPAEHAGLRPSTIPAIVNGKPLMVGGDVILKVAGIAIEDEASYGRIQAELSRRRSGDVVPVTVLRDGRQVELGARVP